jgi:hypothetical protein
MLDEVGTGNYIKFINSQVVAINHENYDFNLSLVNLLDLNKYHKVVENTTKYLKIEGLEGVKIKNANITILDNIEFGKPSEYSRLEFFNSLDDDDKLRIVFSINYGDYVSGYKDISQTEIKDLIYHLTQLLK